MEQLSEALKPLLRSYKALDNCSNRNRLAEGYNCSHDHSTNPLSVFRYEHLLAMPHMPDMTYANNWLIIEHKTGFALKWNCLDALLLVAKELPKHIKVSASADWLKAREDCQFSKVEKQAFDWTFTNDYKGTLVADGDLQGLDWQPTEDRIDIEKLKAKEEILFYDDIHLFEDELADHGVAQCSVKIVRSFGLVFDHFHLSLITKIVVLFFQRVMKTSFYILLRYFLRIDNVLVRLNDTRLYHEVSDPIGNQFYSVLIECLSL